MTTPPPAAAPAQNPGMTLGVIGLILAILWPLQLIGLILSIVGRSQSKKVGMGNGPATAGIIISIVIMVLTILGFVVFGSFFASIFGNLAQVCATYGPGEHVIDGITYTCGG